MVMGPMDLNASIWRQTFINERVDGLISSLLLVTVLANSAKMLERALRSRGRETITAASLGRSFMYSDGLNITKYSEWFRFRRSGTTGKRTDLREPGPRLSARFTVACFIFGWFVSEAAIILLASSWSSDVVMPGRLDNLFTNDSTAGNFGKLTGDGCRTLEWQSKHYSLQTVTQWKRCRFFSLLDVQPGSVQFVGVTNVHNGTGLAVAATNSRKVFATLIRNVIIGREEDLGLLFGNSSIDIIEASRHLKEWLEGWGCSTEEDANQMGSIIRYRSCQNITEKEISLMVDDVVLNYTEVKLTPTSEYLTFTSEEGTKLRTEVLQAAISFGPMINLLTSGIISIIFALLRILLDIVPEASEEVMLLDTIYTTNGISCISPIFDADYPDIQVGSYTYRGIGHIGIKPHPNADIGLETAAVVNGGKIALPCPQQKLNILRCVM